MAVERPARPVIEMKIEPKSKADEPAILLALTAMASLDPTFVVSLDPESREIILKGCGERHLNRKIEQLRQFHGIDFNLGAQQVVYLEALRGSAGVDYSVSMPTGRSRMFARVTLHLQFVDLDLGNEFISDVAPDEAWDQYVHAVEIGVRQVWDCGVLIGFPIVNSRVTLLEVGFLEDESSPMAFQAAARAAMKEGCEKGGIKLLEPIMTVEVRLPKDLPEGFVGEIINDVLRRRGWVQALEHRMLDTLVRSVVPLGKMFGYDADLTCLSRGGGSYDMMFSHYAEAPRTVPDDPDTFPPAVGMRA